MKNLYKNSRCLSGGEVMRKVLLVRWLFCVMSFLTVAAAAFLILDIWRYESQLAYKLGLSAMVLGMACAGAVGFCFAMAL